MMQWNQEGLNPHLYRAKATHSSRVTRVIANKYEVLDTIGAGVLGTCYKVRQVDNQAILVAKEISIYNKGTVLADPAELTVNDGCHGQYSKNEKLKEAAILSQLKHRNLIKLHDYFSEHGYLYLVTEYCEKGDLSNYMENSVCLPKTKIWKFVIEMTLALAYLHNSDIIHCDLKPQNLFISLDHRLKVGDFSSAVISKRTNHFSLNFGTP